jgi:hypothetical protein
VKENQAFGAEETSTKVRVDGKAFVILPLKKDGVGELFAAKSLSCAPSCLQMQLEILVSWYQYKVHHTKKTVDKGDGSAERQRECEPTAVLF